MACSVDSSTLFSFFRQPAACSEGSGTATVGTGMEAGVQNSAVQTAPPPWPLWLPLEQSALFAASSKGSWVLQMATHLWDRPANCFRVFILDPLSWRDHWFVLIGTLIFFSALGFVFFAWTTISETYWKSSVELRCSSQIASDLHRERIEAMGQCLWLDCSWHVLSFEAAGFIDGFSNISVSESLYTHKNYWGFCRRGLKMLFGTLKRFCLWLYLLILLHKKIGKFSNMYVKIINYYILTVFLMKQTIFPKTKENLLRKVFCFTFFAYFFNVWL